MATPQTVQNHQVAQLAAFAAIRPHVATKSTPPLSAERRDHRALSAVFLHDKRRLFQIAGRRVANGTSVRDQGCGNACGATEQV